MFVTFHLFVLFAKSAGSLKAQLTEPDIPYLFKCCYIKDRDGFINIIANSRIILPRIADEKGRFYGLFLMFLQNKTLRHQFSIWQISNYICRSVMTPGP